MLWALKSRAELERKASDIYGAIVAQARHPDFYAKLGVPDTPIGRYEMVVLHLFLVLDRLRGTSAEALSRTLIEAFVADMDDSLREMGTGDLAVARKVRRAAAGFYERAGEYRRALAAEDPQELVRVLARDGLFGDDDAHRVALASYVRQAVVQLAGSDRERLAEGNITFPAVPVGAENLP